MQPVILTEQGEETQSFFWLGRITSASLSCSCSFHISSSNESPKDYCNIIHVFFPPKTSWIKPLLHGEKIKLNCDKWCSGSHLFTCGRLVLFNRIMQTLLSVFSVWLWLRILSQKTQRKWDLTGVFYSKTAIKLMSLQHHQRNDCTVTSRVLMSHFLQRTEPVFIRCTFISTCWFLSHVPDGLECAHL